jgi:hypothetical protein
VRVGVAQGGAVLLGEVARVVAGDPAREVLIGDGLPGNCQAKRQSGLAVVVVGGPEAHDLGRERIEAVEAHRARV